MLYPCITYSPTTVTKKEQVKKSAEEALASYQKGLKVKIILVNDTDYEMSEETYEILNAEVDKNCPLIMVSLLDKSGHKSLVSGDKLIDLEGYEEFMKQLLLFVLEQKNRQENSQYQN